MSAYSKNKYYTDCDLLSKYCFDNSFKIPNLKQVKLSLNTKLINSLQTSDKDTQYKQILFFLLFILTSHLPYVKSRLNSVKNNVSEDFELKITLTSKEGIYDFLAFLCIVNKINFFFNKKEIVESSYKKSFFFKYSQRVPIENINEIKSFLNLYLDFETAFRGMYLNLNFIIFSSRKFNFRNLSLFWING